MSVIAFIGNKGGAGKTTLAINLATVLHEQNPIYLLDADPQGSALHWAAMVDGESIPQVIDATAGVGNLVQQHRDQAQHILIDCPPQLHAEQTRSALECCDVAVVPVLPSPLDLWATIAVGDAVAQVQQTNPGLNALLVINQLEPRTRLSRLVREAIKELDIPAAKTTLHRRVVYRASVLEGKSVSQMGKPGSVATEEVNSLLAEVLDA